MRKQIECQILFQNHVENCPEVTVECELGCGARPRRVDAEQHLLVCPFRLEPCQHCGEPTRYTDLTVMCWHNILNEFVRIVLFHNIQNCDLFQYGLRNYVFS